LSFEKDPFHHILPIIYCMHGAFFELSICDCAWMVLHTRSAWNGLGAGGCSAACGSACGVTFFRHSPRDCALIRSRELYIEDEHRFLRGGDLPPRRRRQRPKPRGFAVHRCKMAAQPGLLLPNFHLMIVHLLSVCEHTHVGAI
jgi:hypothetical protein